MLNWQKWQMFVDSGMIVRNETLLKNILKKHFNSDHGYITYIKDS